MMAVSRGCFSPVGVAYEAGRASLCGTAAG